MFENYRTAQQQSNQLRQASDAAMHQIKEDTFFGAYRGKDITKKGTDTLARERISNMGLKNKKVTKSYEQQFDELIEKYLNLQTETIEVNIHMPPTNDYITGIMKTSFDEVLNETPKRKPALKDRLLSDSIMFSIRIVTGLALGLCLFELLELLFG
jgi:hypothetical protein